MRYLIEAHAIIPMHPPTTGKRRGATFLLQKEPTYVDIQSVKELYQKHDEDMPRERQGTLEQLRANEGYVYLTAEKEERHGNTNS
jgi:hypothetical protein